MGKATHTHVSRLLCLADLDDVQGCGCMNNALASTKQAVRLKKL